MAVRGERDWEDDAFLQDDLISDDELLLMLLSLLALQAVFRRRLSVLSWWRGASALREPCGSLATKVAQGTKSCTVAFISIPNVNAYCGRSIPAIPRWKFRCVHTHQILNRIKPQFFDVLQHTLQETRAIVEWIEGLQLQLYLPVHSPWNDASSDLIIIMRRRFRKRVRCVIQCMLEVVANHGALPESLWCDFVKTSYGGQPTKNSPCRSLVLYGTGDVVNETSAFHLQTQFLREFHIFPSMNLKETSVVSRPCCSFCCCDDSSSV